MIDLNLKKENSFTEIVRAVIKYAIGGIEEVSHSEELIRGGLAQSDLLFRKENKLLIVELKVFTYAKPNIQDIENAALQIVSFSRFNTRYEYFGLLITSYFVNARIKEKIESKYGVKVWDRNSLFTIARKRYKLEKALENTFYSIYPDYDRVSYSYLNDDEEKKEINLFENQIIKYETTPSYAEGLLSEIKTIDTGKENGNAVKFETWCVKVIKYLFADQITELKDQSRSENLFRYDAIGRISRRNEFWEELYQDFRSKFIIFEFKNYRNPITQKEIYTTEKYLFPKALRSVAFIISRRGEDKNAKLVRNGALRQEGKLILVFSEEEILQYIDRKKVGDDPNLLIGNKIDEMLISIER